MILPPCTLLLALILPNAAPPPLGRAGAPRATAPTTPDAAPLPAMELVDRDGDAVRFALTPSGRLQMFLCGELCCDPVGRIDYRASDGYVDVEEAEGGVEGGAYFNLAEGEQLKQAAYLGVLADLARVQWAGDAPVALPPAVDALLDGNRDDAELQQSRPGMRLLWAQLLEIFPTEAAASAAVARNSAIVLPYLNRPTHIAGSWAVLQEKFGSDEEALEVVTKNPGLLSCNPRALRDSSADDVRRMAGLVDGVEKLLWWKNS